MSNKNTLIAFFETGDVPSAAQFADMINSSVNLFETVDQSMAGALVTTQLVTPQVSATNVNITGTLTAANATFSVNSINVTTVSANAGYFNASLNVSGRASISGPVSANSLNVTGDVSASTGTVYASAFRSGGGGIFRTVSVVSAAGTTQATGAALGLSGIIRAKGIADGVTTGFLLLANQTGLQQTIYIEENTSCNLWPCVGGQINALSSNAAFAMAGNTQYIVTHIKASGYSVK